MALFQSSVITKHLQNQNKVHIALKWENFKNHFHNPKVQEEIKNLKEEQYQGEFLEDFFVKILGYTKPASSSEIKFNLTTEYKNIKDSKKADGAIIVNDAVKAVIELKGTNTTDLGKIEVQAFGYKNNQPECTYVITSNFEKLRFYIDNAIEHLEFNLFTLTEKDFNLLYLCLAYENIEKDIPKKIKDQSISQEDAITKKLYNDYSLFKRELHQSLVILNPQFDALTLFQKSQKLLDRFLFLFFAEDRQLLPPNSVRMILDQWKKLQDLDEPILLYNRFKKYFGYLNTGFKGKQYDVYAYNGGLFLPDEVLDNITIDDDLLYLHTLKLSEYDFISEVDVNILGHIFENSLNELDEIKAQLAGEIVDKSKTKRKKDGVFYTPKYITKYIVENTVGKLCEEKKNELQLIEYEYIIDKKRQKKTIKVLIDKLTEYRSWLLQLTICDPACGSGAFLNQALDFLINEHKYIDELQAKLFGDAMVLSDVEKSILENNLFGVDLNEESVEIAKLSLWLRTAQPNRKLNDLNNNLKCGNSLIDDVAVAGDKAFNWQQEFPQIFKEKNKKAFHITTAVHDSRTSQRMIDLKVREKRDLGTNPYPNINYFTEEDEFEITQTVAKIVKDDNLNVLAYNICADHIHILLVCEEEKITRIIQKIKSITSKNCTQNRTVESAPMPHNQTMEHAPLPHTKKQTPLWTQKFGCKEIITEAHLFTAIDYIKHNRSKHSLPQHSKELKLLVESINCSYEHAFRQEYNGGFDVVIGNPPYVRVQQIDYQTTDYLKSNYKTALKRIDISLCFIELSKKLIKKDFGITSFITSNQFLTTEYGKTMRSFLLSDYHLIECVDFGDMPIFEDALTYVSIFTFKNSNISKFLYYHPESINDFLDNNLGTSKVIECKYLSDANWNLKDFGLRALYENLRTNSIELGEIGNAWAGLFTGKDDVLMFSSEDLETLDIEKEILLPVIRANNCAKYFCTTSEKYVIYPYKYENGKTKVLTELELQIFFPKAYNYLLSHKKELESRKDSRKTFADREDWYTLTRFGQKNIFDKVKIVSPGEVKDHKFCIDYSKAGFSCARVFAITINDVFSEKYLLCLLNSNLIKSFLQSFSSLKNGGFYSYSSNILNKTPIKQISELQQLPFIEKAELIFSLNEELQEVSQKFQRTLERKFELETLPKKLQDWYLLSFAEFIKELGKKKVKLSLSQEAEWEDYFLHESKKALALKTDIDATDKEIDTMVYELYGLTAAEIEIVEMSL